MSVLGVFKYVYIRVYADAGGDERYNKKENIFLRTYMDV